MPEKLQVAIVGSGNIAPICCTTCSARSTSNRVGYSASIPTESEGLASARKLGLETSHEGVDWLLAQED